MNVIEKRLCNLNHRHDDFPCLVTTVYVCGECGTKFDWWKEGEAVECCVYDQLHNFDDPQPTCLCGARASDADILDSKRLGTLIRCRSCILSVAPEMQTAEQIARAA